MVKILKVFHIICVISLAFGKQSFANDSSSAISTGGIVLEQNENIVMLSENLFLSPSKVRVEYEYLNESEADEELLVAFALPRTDKLNYNFNYPQPYYLDFKTWIDGKEIELKEGNHFKELGVRSKKHKELELRSQLLLTNLESSFPYYLVLRQQIFPSKQIVRVVHEYTPAVGGGIPYYNYLEMENALMAIQNDEGQRKEHGRFLNCTSVKDALPSVKDWIAFMGKSKIKDLYDGENYGKYLVWYSTLSYILNTGRNWKGAIKDFKLTVSADRPFFLNTCFEGLERTSDTSYEFKATNYVPDNDIYLMFHMSIDWERFNRLK